MAHTYQLGATAATGKNLVVVDNGIDIFRL